MRTAILMATAALALPGSAAALDLPVSASWGGEGSNAGQFRGLQDVAVGPNGDVYSLEDFGGPSNRVQRFTADGTFVGTWGSEGTGPGQFQDPRSIATSSTGDVFVVDAFRERVARYAADGTPIAEWGTHGSGAGEFSNPEGIAVFGDNTVWIADRGNVEADEYTAAGGAITSFGGSVMAFDHPIEIATDSNGDVYVLDSGAKRVEHDTPTGALVRNFDLSARTTQTGLDAVAVDAGGHVWIADALEHSIYEYAADGASLATFDKLGGQAMQPVGLAFAPGGDLYVADNTSMAPRIARTTPPDLSLPVAKIDSGPAGTIGANESLDFSFSADKPNVPFQCAQNGGEFAACTSPYTFSNPALGAENIFSVRALNATTGDPGPAATRTFSVIPPPPLFDPPRVNRPAKVPTRRIRLRSSIDTGVTIACPGSGPGCKTSLVARARKAKVGAAKLGTAGKATTRARFKLNKKGRRLLKRKRRLTVRLSLTARRASLPAVRAKQTVKLKLRR